MDSMDKAYVAGGSMSAEPIPAYVQALRELGFEVEP